ncbi:MAG: hypothetical protein A2283_14325 [Lentisphaerae bacterium RIFOXYA12_FULL_48_11]|nr:MAG: hypothetical protein A2283_14325 [Lentisphaerae bacterium RIFOXYA12_FULL_48_11]
MKYASRILLAEVLLLTCISAGAHADGFFDTNSWDAFNAGSIGGLTTRGYFGATFDGRYVYFAPCCTGNMSGVIFHGIALRYDTKGDFKQTSSWESYNAKLTDGLNTVGYAGNITDGRYVYYVPYTDATSRHARVLCYDSTGAFTNASSWRAYDAAGTDGMTGLGFTGAAFDGTNVYFTPFGFTNYSHGWVLKYNTTSNFTNSASWNAFNAGSIGGMATKGYYGTIYDGRYVYFAPFNDKTNFHGRALRLDTHSNFTNSNSWAAFDADIAFALNTVGYKGGTFDGRYIYYAPFRDNNTCHGRVLRHDTTGIFTNASSWTCMDAGNIDGLSTKGYVGAEFDGRYIYFIPYSNESNVFHACFLRYDTQAEFTNISSWSAINASPTDGLITKGYKFGAFDGKYLYFAPYNNNSFFSGIVLRLDTTHAAWSNRYSTYLGGQSNDYANGITCDSDGNAYVTGWTTGTNFPVKSALYSTSGGSNDIFVAKFDPTGQLLFSTFLGGSSDDCGCAIAIDTETNIYVTGWTSSTNFPTLNAVATNHSGSRDAFLTKIKGDGSEIIYSTYIGGTGNDQANSLTIDNLNCAYLAGRTESADFSCSNAMDTTLGGTADAFVCKMSSDGQNFEYSTYLGGSSEDEANGIQVDSAYNVFIAGWSRSTNFPEVQNPSPTLSGINCDVFVAKLNASATVVLQAGMTGGASNDFCRSITIDTNGNSYVGGSTCSPDFPLLNAPDSLFEGASEGFVTKLDATSTGIVFSTFLGGKNTDEVLALTLDIDGHIYAAGFTMSSNFPLRAPYDDIFTSSEAFVTKLSITGGSWLVSTFLGGSGDDNGNAIALDTHGNVFMAGDTTSSNFPLRNAADTSIENTEAFLACRAMTRDTDGDGLTDEYEERFSLEPNDSRDRNLDPDSDGYDNYMEWVSYTDPFNGTSRLNIASASTTGLTFSSSANRIYSLQYILDLVNGTWSNVPGQMNIQGNGTNYMFMDTITNDCRFYRIIVKPPEN